MQCNECKWHETKFGTAIKQAIGLHSRSFPTWWDLLGFCLCIMLNEQASFWLQKSMNRNRILLASFVDEHSLRKHISPCVCMDLWFNQTEPRRTKPMWMWLKQVARNTLLRLIRARQNLVAYEKCGGILNVRSAFHAPLPPFVFGALCVCGH